VAVLSLLVLAASSKFDGHDIESLAPISFPRWQTHYFSPRFNQGSLFVDLPVRAPPGFFIWSFPFICIFGPAVFIMFLNSSVCEDLGISAGAPTSIPPPHPTKSDPVNATPSKAPKRFIIDFQPCCEGFVSTDPN
jgi:hypothetical protein